MNHLKNIKDILSIPTGSRNVATSGYSSFADSQFFLGSQFWPENFQGTSQDMSLSQQSSLEGSEPKFSNSYHTKPLLFGELKDKTRTFGILDKFEENRKKAKEKHDTDVLAADCHDIRETLKNIQQVVADTEKNTTVCQTVLERFDSFASTLKNNLNGLQSDISRQFETLLNEVNSQKGEMRNLEETMKKGEATTAEHGSNLQILKSSLQSLKEEQEKGSHVLEEALKLLSTLVSEHSAKIGPERVMDSAIQTSPGLEQSLSNSLQENKLEGTQPLCASQNLQHIQLEVPPQNPSYVIDKRKFTQKTYRRGKKRPLVHSQKRRCISDENDKSFKNHNMSTNLSEHNDVKAVTSRNIPDSDCTRTTATLNQNSPKVKSSEAVGCIITPFSGWSQDSNSSACLPGFQPILQKLSDESTIGTPVKENLWQLFNMDCDSDF
ncbi:interactor of HORMAD1 protein 1 isoform X2 [Betta splendens]|nr:interactor of HORMAD1 protein 1 isoform X2 [Betta splendens]